MSFDGAGSIPALARMAEIRSRFGAEPRGMAALGARPGAALGPSSSSPSSFAAALAQAETVLRSVTATQPSAAASSTVLTDDTPYAELFRRAGAAYDLDPVLLAAVAKVESGFDPTAVSSAGAEGLMQFMPGTSSGMGVDPWDPASAVDGAARLLRSHLDRFGSMDLALAAYNAGAGNVSRYGGIPPFTQTQAYVAKVLDLAPQGAS